MKNILSSLVLVLIASQFSFAQLPSGVIAPNWTLTDLNGTTHTLYDYLDQGKSVVIDVSATWCSPCWSYHNTHALKDVYNNYGPSGTDEMMVFFIEGDGQTSLADLHGTGSNTLGDWVTGTPYPIINSTAINNDYDIGYFPTVYLICPDRVIQEIGKLTASEIYTEAQLCPVLTTNINDAKVFEIIDPIGDFCTGTVSPRLQIQNYATSQLTSLDIYAKVDGANIDTVNWTGNLDMYETIQVDFAQSLIAIDGNHTIEFVSTNPNGQTDEDASNDFMSSNFSTNSLGTEVTIKVKTDGNPAQSSWDVTLNGTIVASGGNFTTANMIQQSYACLYEDSCYTFNVYDSGNDGLDGNSFGLVFWNGSTVVSFPASTFNNDHIALDFCLTSTQTEEIKLETFNIFPNPVKDILYIETENNNENFDKIILTDIFGKTVKEIDNIKYKTIKIDISNLSPGVYNVSFVGNNSVATKKIIVID